MSDYFCLDEHRNPVPVDMKTWARMFDDVQGRTIAKTETSPGVQVSTVFLGLDHSFGGARPILFETMIFGGDRDQEQWRYATWAEAEAHHLDLVDELLPECVANASG